MNIARQALERLQAGNQRFVADTSERHMLASPARRKALVDDQRPFAIVLGCSDSRVPIELIFDQGLGDLFVVRVAGNIVTRSVLGSVEFSAQLHKARLIVVLGHTGCGAVDAAVKEMDQHDSKLSPNLASIVDQIRPSVQAGMQTSTERDDIVDQSEQLNIHASVQQLREHSEVLDQLITTDGLCIVGARYSLQTSVVEFYETESIGL